MDHWTRLLTSGNLQPDGFLEADQLSNCPICIVTAHHFLDKVRLTDVCHVVVVVVFVVYRSDRTINIVLIRCLVQYSRSTLVAFRACFDINWLRGGLMGTGVGIAFPIRWHGAAQRGCETRGRSAVAGQ